MSKIQDMMQYAVEHKVPIMQQEGMNFLVDFITENRYHHILEIGSAIGYSAIQMALADDENHVITLERNTELFQLAQKNIQEMKLDHRICVLNVDAYEYQIDQQFDFIFIDAAKSQYHGFFEKYYPYLKAGGACFFDNMEFHGLVRSPNATQNRNTKQLIRKIKEFREFIEENEELKSEYYEDVGDGILIVYGKEKGHGIY